MKYLQRRSKCVTRHLTYHHNNNNNNNNNSEYNIDNPTEAEAYKNDKVVIDGFYIFFLVLDLTHLLLISTAHDASHSFYKCNSYINYTTIDAATINLSSNKKVNFKH